MPADWTRASPDRERPAECANDRGSRARSSSIPKTWTIPSANATVRLDPRSCPRHRHDGTRLRGVPGHAVDRPPKPQRISARPAKRRFPGQSNPSRRYEDSHGGGRQEGEGRGGAGGSDHGELLRNCCPLPIPYGGLESSRSIHDLASPGTDGLWCYRS